MKYKPLALAAAALVAGALSFGGAAQAANVMTGSGAPLGITEFQDGNVQEASHRKKWRRHANRHYNDRYRYRYRYRDHDHSDIYLGLGFAPFFSPYYYQPYYAPPAYYAPARGSRHVRWCLDRYRSYNVRTDTFRGYDGDLHRCRSPYRY